jgi:branched-subunit amino acid transport protein
MDEKETGQAGRGCCFDENLLLEKAKELSAFSNSTTRFGNGVVLFAMFVLCEILQEQARQPETNLQNILAIATAIADLSLSLRI